MSPPSTIFYIYKVFLIIPYLFIQLDIYEAGNRPWPVVERKRLQYQWLYQVHQPWTFCGSALLFHQINKEVIFFFLIMVTKNSNSEKWQHTYRGKNFTISKTDDNGRTCWWMHFMCLTYNTRCVLGLEIKNDWTIVSFIKWLRK